MQVFIILQLYNLISLCGGSGKIIKSPCPYCHGTKVNIITIMKQIQSELFKYNITIPSGYVPEEMTLESEGNEDINSYNIGSIIIVYIIDEDESGYSIQNGV